jgi:uncharacterized protein YjbI with pentapeptide repeats
MTNFKSENDFLNAILTSMVIGGKFKFDLKDSLLMDLDLNGVNFEGCELYGGNFCSSVFNNCRFNRVLFRESLLVGVVFKKCDFIECRFSNIESDFDLVDSKIKLLSITRETLRVALRPWS